MGDRPFEEATELRHGLDEGGLGVVAARAGVGKSSCLVQLALSELVAGAPVLHVSLVDAVTHVRRRYDQIMAAVGCGSEICLQAERLRHIHGCFDGEFDVERLDEALHFLAKHVDLSPRLVVLDGGGKALTPDHITALRGLADQRGLELWMTAVTPRAADSSVGADLPVPLNEVEAALDVVVRLVPGVDGIGLRTWRPAPIGWTQPELDMDPRTMLLRTR